MKRVGIRVEPFSTYLERRREGPICPVIVAGETIYVSGLPPFDAQTGELRPMPFEQQADLVLAQMKKCVEAAGSTLERVVKCNVYCTPDPSHFAAFNEAYARYFPASSRRASSFMCRRGPDRSTSKSIASLCYEAARYLDMNRAVPSRAMRGKRSVSHARYSLMAVVVSPPRS